MRHRPREGTVRYLLTREGQEVGSLDASSIQAAIMATLAGIPARKGCVRAVATDRSVKILAHGRVWEITRIG